MKFSTDSAGTIRLEGSLDIHHAAQLHRELSSVLRSRPLELVVDLAGVTDLDTAGVQVLMAFKRSTPGVTIRSCPTALREWLERGGFLRLLS